MIACIFLQINLDSCVAEYYHTSNMIVMFYILFWSYDYLAEL